MINSGGYKVQIEEVENKISAVLYQAIPQSEEFFITGLPDSNYGEKVTLVVKSESALDESETTNLIRLLKQQLHPYKVPKQVFSLREFRYTHTGKIDRDSTMAMLATTNQ